MMKNVLLALGYLLSAVVIVGGTIVLVAYGEGYRYDFGAHRLVRNGLILVDSTPSSASVQLNGKDTKKRTPYRKSTITGTYDITLSRVGFKTWNRSFDVTSDEVSLAQYVQLIPNDLATETLANHDGGISNVTPAPDRRHVAYLVPTGADAGVWLSDTTNRNPKRLYQPAAGEVVTSLAISDDGQHVLTRVAVGDVSRFIIVSSGDAVVDIAATFGAGFDNLRFAPGNWRELYWLSTDGLRRLSLGDKTTSSVLAEKVIAYDFAGDRVVYVQQPAASEALTASLWMLDRGGRKQQLDGALPLAKAYAFDYATYRGVPQLAVVMQSVATTRLYKEVLNDGRRSVSSLVTGDASRSLFNDDGRYLAIAGSGTSVYDWEKSQLVAMVAPVSTNALVWYDNFHLLSVREGKAVVAEYDGNYANEVGTTASAPTAGGNNGHDVVLSSPAVNGSAVQQLFKVKTRP